MILLTANELSHKVDLVSSHGHTTFHVPAKMMTGQIGDGAAIAAETGLPVISDLRAMDMALGGHGAPIVPMGEKILFPEFDFFLNLGGIANISLNTNNGRFALDVCAANRVLNMLANLEGAEYDEDGMMAASGTVDEALLEKLEKLPYYGEPYPKSLANDFGTDTVFPLTTGYDTRTALRTYVEHIAIEIARSAESMANKEGYDLSGKKLFITGGGAFNTFLVNRLRLHFEKHDVEIHLARRPGDQFQRSYGDGLTRCFEMAGRADRSFLGNRFFAGQYWWRDVDRLIRCCRD